MAERRIDKATGTSTPLTVWASTVFLWARAAQPRTRAAERMHGARTKAPSGESKGRIEVWDTGVARMKGGGAWITT